MIDYEYDKIRPVGDYLSKPSSTLYNDLLSLKEDSYRPNQRIIFSQFEDISDEIVNDFVHGLQKNLTFLDIPNYFVLIITNNKRIGPMLQTAKAKYSYEETAIGFELLDEPLLKCSTDNVPLLNPPDTICAQPWISLDVSSKGEFRPCCFYKGSITDDAGVPYRADVDSFETVYNSNNMKQLRRDFIQGKKPDRCVRCWNEEADGVTSKRQLLKHRFKPLGYTTNWEQDDISNLLYVSISFGNNCNLKCRICDHTSSSQIAIENIKHSAEKKLHPAYMSLKNGLWIKKDNASVWDNLSDPNLNFIHLDISGGEPMLSKKHFSVLQELVNSNRSKDITIHYNTNGTIFPAEHIDLLKQFKSVDIALSIDNLHKQFEYERSGAIWNDVANNIDKYLSINYPTIKISIHLAINIQNVYYLPEVCDWISTKDFDEVHFSTLYFPEILNISNLTKEANGLVLSKLKHYKNTNPLTSKFINNTIEILETAQPSDGKEFLDYMQDLDKIRNESFLESHPEIAIAMGYVRTHTS